MRSDTFVQDSIDNFIASEEDQRMLDGLWHPSSLSSPCTRRAILEKLQVPQTNPAGAKEQRNFKLGHIIHEFVQNALAHDTSLSSVETEVHIMSADMSLDGHADVVMVFKNSGVKELVEVKSTKEIAFRYGLPKQEHLMQALSYAHFVRPDRIRIVYVGKESMEIREFVTPWTEKLDRKFITRMTELNTALAYHESTGGWLPTTKLATKDQWFGRYCPYRGSGQCCAD